MTQNALNEGRQDISPAESDTVHQAQYDEKMARFFEMFNQLTGRRELYQGYLAGYLGQKFSSKRGENIAVDFGCGTGWLAETLPQLGFSRVYGIDSSEAMLMRAFSNASKELTTSGRLCYRSEIPSEILGRCSLVTAVHVHYHFEPREELRTAFFGAISSLLKENGEAILVGCPSDHIRETPYHYQNSVRINDVPDSIMGKASSPAFLADKDGFIPLTYLPPFPLKEGTQMKVTLKAKEPNGDEHTAEVTDTFWSDLALTKAAQDSGLKLINKQNLTSGGHPNAYMVMHFKKTNTKTLG